MVDEDILVSFKKNRIDPCEENPTQDAVEFFGRLALAESTECWALGATLEYQKCRVHVTTNKYRT